MVCINNNKVIESDCLHFHFPSHNTKNEIKKQPYKPDTIAVNPAGLPTVVTNLPQWLLWRWRKCEGEWSKYPISASTLNGCNWTDPANHVSFDFAVKRYEETRRTRAYQLETAESVDGIGFVFMNNAGPGGVITGCDWDECRFHDGRTNPDAISEVLSFNSYRELSPTGGGFHCLCIVPPETFGKFKKKHDKWEAYQAGRWFAVTGVGEGEIVAATEAYEVWAAKRLGLATVKPNIIRKPVVVSQGEDHTDYTLTPEDMDRLDAFKQDEKALRLWDGGWQEDYPNDDGDAKSEAVQGFLWKLAFYFGDKPFSFADYMFRKSALWGGKWADGKWQRLGETEWATALACQTGRHHLATEVTVEEIPCDPANLGPTAKTEQPQEEPVFADNLTDTMFAYLWRGKHAAYTEDERRRRIMSVKTLLPFAQPPLFYNWLKAYLPSTDSPPIFLLGAVIGLVCTLLGKRTFFRHGGKRVRPCLWVALVAPPGMRKSHALNTVRDNTPWQLSGRLLAPKQTLASIETRLATLVETDEQAAQLYHEPDPEKCVGTFLCDELSVLLGNMQQSHNSGLAELLTGSYEGIRYDESVTQSRGRYVWAEPCLSILGGATPDGLRKTLGELHHQGFLGRCLFLAAEEQDYRLVIPDPIDNDALALAKQEIARIDANCRGEYTLSPEAEDYYLRWGRQSHLSNGGEAWQHRWINLPTRLAQIYQAATDDNMVISADTMRAVSALLDYAQPSVERTGGNLPLCDDDRNTKRLRAVVQAGGKVSRRDALRKTGLNLKSLGEAAKTLAEQGDIAIVKARRGNQVTEAYHWIA